mmetsp:Transcript_28017/g.93090  ORF Transcript_28017/g.93090 Transcript_28017/m.93090 type:complete len:225 (+) Transcript_28017:145-819(+)
MWRCTCRGRRFAHGKRKVVCPSAGLRASVGPLRQRPSSHNRGAPNLHFAQGRQQVPRKRLHDGMLLSSNVHEGEALTVQEVAGAPPGVGRKNLCTGVLPVGNRRMPHVVQVGANLVAPPSADPADDKRELPWATPHMSEHADECLGGFPHFGHGASAQPLLVSQGLLCGMLVGDVVHRSIDLGQSRANPTMTEYHVFARDASSVQEPLEMVVAPVSGPHEYEPR